MDVNTLTKLGRIQAEIPAARETNESATTAFTETLESAIREVDELQKSSGALQRAFAEGAPVELHDVLIRVEEAEVAFKTMMEIRNKLIGAYQEIMRMGGGG